MATALAALAAVALVTVAFARSNGSLAAAAEYGYCPGSASAVYYGYCPAPNRPPDCSTVVADKDVLLPADGRLRLVILSGGSDPDGDPLTLTITGVTQDEPVDAPGSHDGATAPDAEPGPDPQSVFLRRERSSKGDGRVYRVAFTLSDGRGGTCSGVVKVGVPLRKGRTPVDSAPPSYDSFAA